MTISLLLALSFFTPLARADHVPPLCTNLLQQVRNLGWKKVNGVDLKKVVDGAAKLSFFVEDKHVIYQVGDRDDANYQLSLKPVQILFTYNAWHTLIESDKTDLCTHEIVAAQGFRDNNYSTTLALKFLAANHIKPLASGNPDFSESLFTRVLAERKAQDGSRGDLYASGGTIVGGGGDSFDLQIKYRALEKILSLSEQGTANLEKAPLEKMFKLVLDCDIHAKGFTLQSDGSKPLLGSTGNAPKGTFWIQIDRSQAKKDPAAATIEYLQGIAELYAQAPAMSCGDNDFSL